MALSLKDQLLKAGLADNKKARRAEHEKRQEKRDPNAKSAADLAQEALAQKIEKDRELNRLKQEEQEQKALGAQIRQLVASHRISRQGGDVSFQFTEGKKIKKLYVTAQQQDQLARGQIAIISLDEQHELVPTVVAEKIAQRNAGCVVLLNNRQDSDAPEDDPYKDYPIPDDLMW